MMALAVPCRICLAPKRAPAAYLGTNAWYLPSLSGPTIGPPHVLAGSEALKISAPPGPGAGTGAYPSAPQLLPVQGASQEHMPAVHSPFRLQSAAVLQPPARPTAEDAACPVAPLLAVRVARSTAATMAVPVGTMWWSFFAATSTSPIQS